MNDYTVHIWQAGTPSPLPFPYAFERLLFNEPQYLLKQADTQAFIFLLVNTKRNVIEARFSFLIDQLTGHSPYHAPFGSLEFPERLDIRHLDFFLDQIEAFVLSKGLKKLWIKHYPFCYGDEQAQILAQRLLHRGFEPINSELNFHLPITASSFESNLHLSEKRRLNKCLKAGFTFVEDPHPDLERVYAFIVACRQRRGFPVSLAEKDFKILFYRFPEVYKVFLVKDRTEIAALTVTVRINERILYNFYPADAVKYQVFSPVVLLTKGLYQYCQERDFRLLDLGISTDKGAANYGLIRFKQNLGAQVSLKLTFEKTL